MGGGDKGLMDLAGHPLIEHILQSLVLQVGTIIINANRHLETYARSGPPVATRLAAVLGGPGGPGGPILAVAHDGSHLQPVHAVIPVTLAESLQAYLAGGGRRIDGWLALHPVALADFSDRPECFRSLNTREDWQAFGPVGGGG
jgi:molybdopterin-guanine dinucleotide biosynthesis protein A